MVCTPDLYYQEFKMQDADLRKWKHEWLKRMNQYYEMLHDEKEQARVMMNPEDFFNGA
jgi:hypothetical protein